MQYPVVVLLVIISFWAATAFREKVFRIIALGWAANLAYLVTGDPTRTFVNFLHLSVSHLDAPAQFFDFAANALFWFAAHKSGKSSNRLYLSNWKTGWFLCLPVASYVLSTIAIHLFPPLKFGYPGFLAFTIPTVLADGIAITALGFYFRDLAVRTDNFVPNKGNLLFTATIFYAAIQLLQFAVYKSDHKGILTFAFALGLTAKGFIFLGIVRLLVASAEALSGALAEKNRAEEFVTAIDLLAHEMGTPIGEIKVCVDSLSKPRNAVDATLLKSIESAASRAAAILQSSKFAVTPSAPKRAFKREGETWLSAELHKRQRSISVNTLIEIAQSSVKSTRKEIQVFYSHHYSGSCCIECVPSEIVQIFINVFRNCYDAIEKIHAQGKIDIYTLNEKDPRDQSSKGKVKVIIRDNGEGISPDRKVNLFEARYSTRPGRGRGFGLLVSKDLVEKNRGTIEINSPPSAANLCGTEVVISFPRVECTH